MISEPYVPRLSHPPPPAQPHALSDEALERRIQESPRGSDFHERQKRQLERIEQQAEQLLAAQKALRESVDHLKAPRWIDWAILVVGTIAAAATVWQLLR